MAEEEFTTLRLKNSTRERLGKFGSLNDTFDDVLNQLMDVAEKVKK